MRIQTVFCASLLCVTTACASHRDQTNLSSGRVTTLEAEVRDFSATPHQNPWFPDLVHVELGDTEFYGGDSIVVTDIHGTADTLQLGGIYVVKGRYHLASYDRATLLLSVTTTERSRNGPSEPNSEVRVFQGDGEFTLVKHLNTAGYPHLSFYGLDGHPFGGIYFGTGEWLLKTKEWRYGPPPPNPIIPEDAQKPLKLL